MNNVDIVVSPEVARKLVDSKIILQTIYYWEYDEEYPDESNLLHRDYLDMISKDRFQNCIPAPTAGEIPLPAATEDYDHQEFKVTNVYYLRIEKDDEGKWNISYVNDDGYSDMDVTFPYHAYEKLCDAMAEALLDTNIDGRKYER